MNKKKVFISSFSENAIEVCKRLNTGLELNHICISEMLDKDKIENTIIQMRKDMADTGFNGNIVVHGPFTEIVPCAIDPRAINLAMTRLNEAYYVANALGINKMVVHSGYLPPIYHKGWHVEKSTEFWRKFMYDKPRNFYLYIENVLEDEPYMMRDLIDSIDDDRVSICLDIGHGNVMKAEGDSIENWIDILGDRISHVHLHNNFGDKDNHNEVNTGNIDIFKVLDKLRDIEIKSGKNKEISLTIESRKAEDSGRLILEYIDKKVKNIL